MFIVVSTAVLLLHMSVSYMNHQKGHVLNSHLTCKNYFGKQFVEKIPVCSKSQSLVKESILCEKNPVSTMMAKCTIQGLVVEKFVMIRSQPKLRSDMVKVRQLESEKKSCSSPFLSGLYRSTEDEDYVRHLVKKVIQSKPLRPNKCGFWLKETVYFFGSNHHIYFRFLGWYNLFKTIYYDNNQNHKYTIIRFSEEPSFADVEKRLFPNLIPLSDLQRFPVCIQRAVLVPRSFTSTPFRCKMELLGFCSDCLTLGVDEPTFFKFRNAMLKACSIDSSSDKLLTKNILVVLRKPYKRYGGDVGSNFERVMTNEAELLSALRSNFTMFNVLPVYMEDLTLCEQINVSSSAQVFMGVHGAGMSHLWWTPKGATILEMMPDYKSGKPSFKILSQLMKARYIEVRAEGEHETTVNIDEVVDVLKRSIV